MITKNYIKMCAKAKEIQKLFQFKQGEWYIHKGHYIVLDESIISVAIINQYKKEKAIWLPTQEQLQEIILPILREKYNNSVPLRKMNREGIWVMDLFHAFLTEDRLFHSNDMNELWLAFVMKEKYNKIWTGEDWVNETNTTR